MLSYCCILLGGGGRGTPLHIWAVCLCGPKEYGFLAILVISRVSMLAILVIN